MKQFYGDENGNGWIQKFRNMIVEDIFLLLPDFETDERDFNGLQLILLHWIRLHQGRLLSPESFIHH